MSCGSDRKHAASIPSVIGTIATLVLALYAPAPASAQDTTVCAEFTKKSQRIERLGTPHAFSKKPVRSPTELAAALEAHRGEIESLMASRGVGHLVDGLIAASTDPRRLSERPLRRGEVFEWMAWRMKDGPTTTGPHCFAAKKTYEAYEIQVTEESMTEGSADCSLSATGKWDDEKIMVRAAGSSPGVEVTMSGPGGTKTVISGESTSWEGMPEGPGTYTFTARAKAQGSKAVTTHTFLAPKICLNLAYVGSTTTEEGGEADTCTETATVVIEPRLPSCEIVEPTEMVFYRKALFTLNATGENYDSLSVRFKDAATGQYVDVRGEDRRTYSEVTSFPVSVSIKKAGEYVIEGTASNAQGTEMCEKRITIEKPPTSAWTFRGFLAKVDTDDDMLMTTRLRSPLVEERTKLRFDGGEGLGAGLEYHFNDRVGLEGTVIWADLDSSFILDINAEWERDTDSSSTLMFLFGPNFHLTPGKPVDFYIGLFAGLVDIGGASYTALGESFSRDFDDDFAFGGQIGLDFAFGSSDWGLHLGGRYIDLSVDVGGGQDGGSIDLNPLIFELGLFKDF